MQLFPGRSIPQLRSHYNNKLKDTVEKASWSLKDDKLLLEYVEVYKTDWAKISQLLGSRFSRTSCRTRYSTISKYLASHPGYSIEDVPRRKRKPNEFKLNKANWMEKIREIPNLIQKDKPRSEKRRIKDRYRERLRPTERDYYEYFKYSFDYNYGYDFEHIFSDLSTMAYISNTLEFEEFFSTYTNRPPQIPPVVFQNLIRLGQFNNAILHEDPMISPNWNTFLGLRSLLIFKSTQINNDSKARTKKIKKEKEDQRQVPETDGELECHKILFKKRFKAIFWKTAVMSSLHASEFKKNVPFSIELVNDR